MWKCTEMKFVAQMKKKFLFLTALLERWLLLEETSNFAPSICVCIDFFRTEWVHAWGVRSHIALVLRISLGSILNRTHSRLGVQLRKSSLSLWYVVYETASWAISWFVSHAEIYLFVYLCVGAERRVRNQKKRTLGEVSGFSPAGIMRATLPCGWVSRTIPGEVHSGTSPRKRWENATLLFQFQQDNLGCFVPDWHGKWSGGNCFHTSPEVTSQMCEKSCCQSIWQQGMWYWYPN